MPSIDVRSLGDFIREQRLTSQISVRELAKLAGVSNPYLSQIERGLRKPSAEILQQIAKGLRISAEALYVQAGILEHREGGAVTQVLLSDETINERQKQVLLEIYESFRKENAAVAGLSDEAAITLAEVDPTPPAPARRSRPASDAEDTKTVPADDAPAGSAAGRRATPPAKG